MAVLVYGMDGVEGVTLREDPSPGFTPVEGSADAVDTSFFWTMLPDDLHDMPPADRRFFEAAWRGMVQYGAAALAEISHLDQTSGLRDFPLYLPRKWVFLPIRQSADLSANAPRLVTNLPGTRGARLLRGKEAAVQTVMEVAQSAALSGAAVPLEHSQSDRAGGWLRASVALRDVYPSAADPLRGTPPNYAGEQEAWFLCGYGTFGGTKLSPGCYAGVSTSGRIAAVSVHAGAAATWEISSDVLGDVGGGVTLTLSMEPLPGGRGRIHVSAVGDPSLPAAEVSLDANVAFRATHVVMAGADTRVRPAVPWDGLFSGNVRTPFSVIVQTLEWLDVSLPAETRAIPVLRGKVSSGEEPLVAGVDYLVAFDADEKWAELRFVDPVPVYAWLESEGLDGVWAEHLAADGRLLERIFGPLVGVPSAASGPDSLELRNKLFALLYGLVSGPHPGALSVAVGALAGVPIALETGVVWSINTTSVYPEIVVRGASGDRRYRYPDELRPLVSVGDTVAPLQQLVQHPVLRDWTSGGDFVRRLRVNGERPLIGAEVEKFSALHVEVPYGARGMRREDEGTPNDLSAQVHAYLARAGALWTGVFRAFISLAASLQEDLRLLDRIDYSAQLSLLSTLTNARDPRYNDHRAFLYDGTLRYGEVRTEVLPGRFHAAVTNTSGAPVTVHVFGADVTIAAGDTVTVTET